MAKDQIYSSVIRLNTEDAQNKMEDLKKRVQDLVALRDTIDKKKDSGYYKSVSKQINAAKAELKVYENEVMKTIQTLDNLGNASAKDIRDAQKSLQKMIDAKPQGAEELGEFVRRLQEVKQELQSIATMRAFDEVKAGITGTGKSAQQLGAEMRFLRETSENAGSASVQQLEKALEVAQEHLKVAKQGSRAYERSSEYIRQFNAQLEESKAKQRQSVTLIDRYNRELKETGKEAHAVKDEHELIRRTLDNISKVSVRDLEYSIKALNEQMRGMDRDSDGYKEAEKKVKRLRTELERTRQEASAQQSAWGKLIGFLNTNWGAITQILGTLTGLTMTMRKSVQDYAAMEEEMANVRKYTGLADGGVKELNEDLKQMDTRTSREELNQLAGSAGRLGIQAKESILEFVDAADKIKVALGDDLGDGAVDQIGKLAMAFGEDERMGLRGAMLATGSAVNELAQNSSANAGFLVDYTARVAGFGKQLGLTQAQIMGYGAVMDENLLRDEMAATAFGNMLTKMQTDTEKFARIAGQSVGDFTKLLNEDANQAILNLADSLRSQDPQTMMKMLDDMGLDGARAVGVLSTMADKIDDVREHQRLATEAYKEGNSVVREFGVMNTTVQARLEKCKKQFHEMTVELGEQLLPVVRYTCTGFSLLVQGLSVGSKFINSHKGEIIAVSAAIASYTAYVKAATIATKLHTIATKGAKLATEAFNFVTKMNPIGLLIAALTAAVVLFIKYRDRINGAGEAMTMLRSIAAKLSGAMASLAQRVIDLIKWTVSLYDRFAFIRKIIQLLVTSFTTGFTTITAAVKLLLDELDAVGNIIEGIFTLDWGKIKEGYKQGFKAIADAAVAQFNNVKRTVKEVFSAPPPAGSGANALAAGAAVGATVGKVAADTPVEQSLPEIVVTPKKKKKYVSDAEHKQLEKEQRKAEAERKKKENEERKALHEQSKQLKAEMDNRLAEEAVSYSVGLINYRDYIARRQQIQLEGIAERKRIFKEGSTEWLRLDAEEKTLQLKGDEEQRKLTLKEYEQMHRDLLLELERDYNTEGSAIYHNEEALREMRFQEDMDFLEQKKSLARKGSLEQMQIEWEIQDRNKEHQTEREREYMERLSQYRQEMGRTDYQQLQEIEIKGIEVIYGALLKSGQMTQAEYDAIIDHIRRKYAELQGEQAANNDVQERASKGLETARKMSGAKGVDAGDDIATGVFSIAAAVQNQAAINEQLKILYGEDYENNREYQEAKRQLDMETMQGIVAGAQAAYQSISQFMSAASGYAQACSDLEVARITANYDRQIEAAGSNERKRKKLEEKKQKEIAAAKTKANKKAMAMEMAQAVAQTAMGAISAYMSTLSGAPYPANLVLAPISAGIALAAGAIQIATIKKQHQAQEAGYYEGGFTGGRRYQKEAGVVHEGEFVANHQAVNNPNVLPFLNFLDQAQRNNTVGSLTAQDVSQQLGQGSSTVIAPVVNVTNDNEELRDAIDGMNESAERLNRQLELGIKAYSDTEQTYKALKEYERIKNNA